jgi:hypothetical protein
MRFFTPELYVRFNSPDETAADEAYLEWERAGERYAQELDAIRDRLPSQVRRLTEMNLHDALVLSRGEEIQAGAPPILTERMEHLFAEFPFPVPFVMPVWTAIGVVTVKGEGALRSLIYCLRDRIQVRTYRDWPFSKAGEHWLYDELEFVPFRRGPLLSGGYIHRILLSSGLELEIPFTTLFIHEFSLAKIGAEVVE